MSALALREDQDYWDEAQLSVLRASGIEEGVTKAELQTFLHECQRRKLDPFTRQIYLIGRFDRRQKRKVYRSQTSIDGFRLIARRAADKAGIDYSYEDTIWFDAKAGRHEIWLANEPPAGAKVVVVRNGCRYDAEVRYSEYVVVNDNGDATGQWKTRPATMIAKCCEALALRKAFPEDLGGLYTEEEMAQADNPQRVQATAEVVREERIAPNGHAAGEKASDPPEDVWVTPKGSDDWVQQATAQAAALTDKDAARVLYQQAVAKEQAGEITKAQRNDLCNLITAQMEFLEQAAEPVEGTIAPPDGDPWQSKVEEITTAADAERAIAELDQAHADGHIDSRRHKALRAAMSAKGGSRQGAAA